MKIFGDSDLIRRYVAGDKAAFEEVYGRYKNHVYYRIKQSIKSIDTIEELVQQTFVRLLTQLEKEGNKGRESLGPLVYSIAETVLKDYFRDKERTEQIAQELSLVPETYAPPADRELETNQLRDAILRALSSLAPRRREAAKLIHFHGLTYPEVARRMGITRDAVYNLVREANKQLAAKLSHYKGRTEP